MAAGYGSPLPEPVVGDYRASVELPGGEAPFGLVVQREADACVLYLSNGTERTRVPNVTFANGQLDAVFPGYENSLRATMHRRALKASIKLIKAGGKEQMIPFRATLGSCCCPNCHDKAAFLAPWYRENRERGAEIVGLRFERHGAQDPHRLLGSGDGHTLRRVCA